MASLLPATRRLTLYFIPPPLKVVRNTLWAAAGTRLKGFTVAVMDGKSAHQITSPYIVFSREQRPLLPARLTNSEREKLLGQNWKELSEAGRAAYTQGLTKLPCSGRGGHRRWALSQPAAVSVSAETDSEAQTVSATTETATETAAAHPEDQPAAKRSSYQDDQGGFQREAYRRLCKEQRPLLPAGTTNTDREKFLGELEPQP